MDDDRRSRGEQASPAQARDRTVPTLIGVLGGLEVLTLAVLYFVDTPLSPAARRLGASFGGKIVLVGTILLVLCIGTAIFWALLNECRRHR